MSERRSHWTDDLIEAVYAELPAKKYQVEPDSWEVHRIIAAVEDWVLSAPIFDLYLSRKHAPDKAAIQRVREVCADKYVAPNYDYGQGFQNGYNDALAQVLRALDGERDD
jgi:hypothetical protein